jgi:hypothetical protein
MAVDGIVRQTMGGIVVDCTCVAQCMKANPEARPASCVPGGSGKKDCQLSVDHGDRCLAYPNDTTTWLIDTDTSKIKQIPTVR